MTSFRRASTPGSVASSAIDIVCHGRTNAIFHLCGARSRDHGQAEGRSQNEEYGSEEEQKVFDCHAYTPMIVSRASSNQEGIVGGMRHIIFAKIGRCRHRSFLDAQHCFLGDSFLIENRLPSFVETGSDIEADSARQKKSKAITDNASAKLLIGWGQPWMPRPF